MDATRYPIGTQSFRVLRKFDSAYVDKTEHIWRMVNSASRIYFLSRPRRFGKSLLLSTIQAYFEGEKELFEGLYIYEREKEWEKYPVMHFDLSASEGSSADNIRSYLLTRLRNYATEYGVRLEDESIGVGAAFGFLIEAISKKTGKMVVVLVDEYDKGMVDMLDDKANLIESQALLQPFFSQIKAQDQYIRFCFITGVARFRHYTLFSGFNNPNDISLDQSFADVCGITEQELRDTFQEGIRHLADRLGVSEEQAIEAMRFKYDGYRFTSADVMVYNPFSVLNCLSKSEISNFWLSSGTSKTFVKYLERSDFELTKLEDLVLTKENLESTFEDDVPTALLFQTGYLTIKDCEDGAYRLRIPNGEVKSALVNELLPRYMGVSENAAHRRLLEIRKKVSNADIDGFLGDLQSIMASVPYQDMDIANLEKTYHLLIYQAFLMIGVDARSEISMSGGRIDMVAETPRHVYVMEFKLGGTPQQALRQIDEKGYAIPWQVDGRDVYKVGVSFSKTSRTIDGWAIEKA